MGTTSPDAIRYPSDYNLPADVPNDMQKLATDTQTGLSRRMGITPVTGTLTGAANFNAYAAPQLLLFGTIVVCRGQFLRSTSSLAVTDNSVYLIATIPVGFRPPVHLELTCAWQAMVTAGPNIMAAQMNVLPTGQMQLVSNVTGSMRAGFDYVSVGGLVWTTS
jgi:hypothetical protein